jgi:hypothetical protein
MAVEEAVTARRIHRRRSFVASLLRMAPKDQVTTLPPPTTGHLTPDV